MLPVAGVTYNVEDAKSCMELVRFSNIVEVMGAPLSDGTVLVVCEVAGYVPVSALLEE